MTGLIDDLHDAACAWIDQHGVVVHIGVAIAGHVIIGRHVVIGDTLFGQLSADAEFAVVAIGRMPLRRDVSAKARAILDAENASDRADGRTDSAANDPADRAGRAIAFSRACAANGSAKAPRSSIEPRILVFISSLQWLVIPTTEAGNAVNPRCAR